MKSNNFRDQVAYVTTWFNNWSECEQTVALYSLLKKSSPVQAKFLDQVLQQTLADCTDVKQLEAKANDEAFVRSLHSEEKELVIHQLLQLLPLLQVGQSQAKAAYLQLIPELLSHTIHNGVNIEESRQLLSYSLIHPAITTEERGTFQTWLGCLEERFTYSIPHHGGSANGLSSSSSSNMTSSSGGGSGSCSVGGCGSSTASLSVGLAPSHSPSPGSSTSQHSLSHLSPNLSVSQEYINAGAGGTMGQQQQQQQQPQPQPPPGHGGHSPSPLIGPASQLPAWQQQQHLPQQHPAQPHGPQHYAPTQSTGGYDPSAATHPLPNGETSGCAQFVSSSAANTGSTNGHLALRATNSHAGAFGASHGHIPLHATSSAPPNFSTVPPSGPVAQVPSPSPNTHAPLRRTPSITPPVRLQNTEKAVSDWLKTNHGHHAHHNTHHHHHAHPGHVLPHPILAAGSGSRVNISDHAPLSPQSSVTSSGSGGSDSHQDVIVDGPQPTRDSFMEEGSGMREVPVWLKTLRLHKYSYLFRQMTYEDMLSVTEAWLEQQNVTKGARHKIYISISKLRERQDQLRKLEKSIAEEGGSIRSTLGEMKAMLNTPIKAFNPAQHILVSQTNSNNNISSANLSNNNPAYCSTSNTAATTTTTSTTTSSSSSSSPQSPSADEVMEGDLPAQFCRLMGKVCAHLLVTSRPDDECFQIYLQLIDKCLNHEAFSDRQKKLLQTWKQSAQKIWQPPLQKYGDRPRRGYGNTFHVGGSLGGRIIARAGRGPIPLSAHHQQHLSQANMQHWSFGSKRSILGGGHTPVQRNSSLNTAFLNKPGLLEQAKQPVSRTHSAPTHRPLTLPLQGCENANDTEINERLDSLCISMTEHALGSSDTGDRGATY